MLRRFHVINSVNAHSVLPQSESVSAADVLVHRGYEMELQIQVSGQRSTK